MAIMSICVDAQQIEFGVQAEAKEIPLSRRWHMSADAKAAVVCSPQQYNYRWIGSGLQVNFNVYQKIYAFARLQMDGASYNGIENSDYIFAMAEGANITTDHGFFNQLIIEQRLLKYRPSNIKANASRFTYLLSKKIEIQEEKWFVKPEFQCSFNINSEAQNSNFVQRCRFFVSVYRILNKKWTIDMKYGYMFCGKRQGYIGDSHNMHIVQLSFDL